MSLPRPTHCLLLLLPWLIAGQIPFNQYGPLGNNDPYQQQQQQQQMYPQQQMYQQQQQQQQPFYQGNPGGGGGMVFPPPPVNKEPPPSGNAPSENYLVGNLSQPFSFHVASPSSKVNHLGLNGFSLFIKGLGFSDKSRFDYDEQTNLLTVRSLDRTTVGYYVAVDANWQTIVTVVSAIDVSSLEIHNARTTDNSNNGSGLVWCSVSIIRSTFKLADPPSQSNNGLPPRVPSNLVGTEYLPRLDLFLPGRTSQPTTKIANETLNEQIFTRTLTLQRPLTRADHNGTIQCQVEASTNLNVYLVKTVQADVQYGPELEAGASERVDLQAEALRSIAMDCQIEGNPNPSYIWYDLPSSNLSSPGMMPYYGQQNPFGQQPLPGSNIPTAGLSVFGITRQIQKIYQNPGRHVMQCQAQSRGKTIKQEFFINVLPSSTLKDAGGMIAGQGKSYKVPMIIGASVGGVLLLLLLAIVAAVLIFLRRRRRAQAKEPRSLSSEKLSTEKPGKDRWGHPSGGMHPKYKQPSSRVDSASPLVESGDSYSSHGGPPPSLPASRPSPPPSRESSYRQAPGPSALSYVQASSISGVRPPPTSMRSYSPEPEEIIPVSNTRSRTTTPFGSHKSLSESIQSLRSTQQRAISLPMKKRSDEAPPLPAPILPKREQRTPSPKPLDPKKDYQHHHYHNPAQLRAEQRRQTARRSSDEDEGEDAASGSEVPAQPPRRPRTPPPPQKIAVHQPTALHRDEIPPPYQQVAHPSPYAYQEPTEV